MIKQLLFASLVSFASSTAVYAETISFVIRTFIPREHPGRPGYMLPVPEHPERTMLPKAPVGQCFGTDNRTFSDKLEASARFGGRIDVDPSAGSIPKLTLIQGMTKEYNCETGKVICDKPSGGGGFSISNIKITQATISFDYSGEASNPCLAIAPDIEFRGTVTISRMTKTASIHAKNDVFPSFEAVLFANGSAKSLFRVPPLNDATPASLVTSSPSRSVSGNASF